MKTDAVLLGIQVLGAGTELKALSRAELDRLVTLLAQRAAQLSKVGDPDARIAKARFDKAYDLFHQREDHPA